MVSQAETRTQRRRPQDGGKHSPVPRSPRVLQGERPRLANPHRRNLAGDRGRDKITVGQVFKLLNRRRTVAIVEASLKFALHFRRMDRDNFPDSRSVASPIAIRRRSTTVLTLQILQEIKRFTALLPRPQLREQATLSLRSLQPGRKRLRHIARDLEHSSCKSSRHSMLESRSRMLPMNSIAWSAPPVEAITFGRSGNSSGRLVRNC
jgi:hypothetical protein